jgi:hypothetical protein
LAQISGWHQLLIVFFFGLYFPFLGLAFFFISLWLGGGAGNGYRWRAKFMISHFFLFTIFQFNLIGKNIDINKKENE